MKIFENYFTEFILVFVLGSIIYAQYLFFSGNELYALFVGLWAPTVLGIHNALTNRSIREFLVKKKHRRKSDLDSHNKLVDGRSIEDDEEEVNE